MANFIREVRVSAGLTQSDLAKELGVTQGAITYWENEKRIPSMRMVYKLSKALHTSPARLFDKETLEKIRSESKLDDLDSSDEEKKEEAWDYLLSQAKEFESRQKELDAQEDGMINLITIARKLNEQGRERLLRYAEDITELMKYQKTDK